MKKALTSNPSSVLDMFRHNISSVPKYLGMPSASYSFYKFENIKYYIFKDLKKADNLMYNNS